MINEVARRLHASSRKSPYFSKDLRKAAVATQFIGQGSSGSSTHAYAAALGDLANTGRYSAADVVFVSAEGARASRFDPIGATGLRGAYRNIDLAITARASFVIDTLDHRGRPYNIGERQIAAYLSRHGYVEIEPGVFGRDDGPRSGD